MFPQIFTSQLYSGFYTPQVCASTMEVGGILLSDLWKYCKYWFLIFDIDFEYFLKSLATDFYKTSISYLSIPYKGSIST